MNEQKFLLLKAFLILKMVVKFLQWKFLQEVRSKVQMVPSEVK